MPFVDLETVESRELIPGTKVRFVHSDTMTLAYWTFEPGVDLPIHSHPHDQVTNVVEGELELTLEGETRTLTPGTVAVIPPDAVHSARSITRCRVIDSFYPVRSDYL